MQGSTATSLKEDTEHLVPEPHHQEEDPGLGVPLCDGGGVAQGLPGGEHLTPVDKLVHGVLPGQGQHLVIMMTMIMTVIMKMMLTW